MRRDGGKVDGESGAPLGGEALPDAPRLCLRFPGPETLALADWLALKALGMLLAGAPEALPIHLAQATLVETMPRRAASILSRALYLQTFL